MAALHALGAGEQADAEVRRSERQVMTAPDDQQCLHLFDISSHTPLCAPRRCQHRSNICSTALGCTLDKPTPCNGSYIAEYNPALPQV